MSDILNHYYCAREVYHNLSDDDSLVDILTKYYDAYRLGSQGPDFFYYNILDNYPLTVSVAKLIHSQNIDKFFYYGLKFALKHPEYSEICLAYLAGFASHHALDTLTHPFIYYRSGKELENRPETKKRAPLHKLYEVMLDTAMTQYEYSRQAVFESPEKVFIINEFTLEFLEYFYKYVLKKIFGINIERKDIEHSLKSAARIIALTKDPLGRKRKYLKKIEKKLNNTHILSKMFYPMYTNEFHILNIGHRKWLNPVTGEEHFESYPQLFHKAVDKTQDSIEQLTTLYKSKQFTLEDVTDIFNNLSYLSGVRAEDDQTYKYFDDQFINYLYNNF